MLVKIFLFIEGIFVIGITHYMNIYVLERVKNHTLHYILDAIFLIVFFYLVFLRDGGFMTY